MRLIKHLLFVLLLFIAQTAPAQMQGKDSQAEKWRKKINLDYTVPDYHVKKPDAKVIGWRLAMILHSLEQNYMQPIYSHYLTMILSHQMSDGASLYAPIHKMKTLDIQKQDSIITIRIKLFSKTKGIGKIEQEIPLTFVNSVSKDDIANTLFSELGQYIKKREMNS